MVNSCRKGNFWWFERVVGWETDVEEEDTSCVWRIIRAHDRRLPRELIFLIEGTSRTVRGRVLSEVDEFFLDSF